MIRNNNSFISENYILLGTPLTRQSDIESIIHNAKNTASGTVCRKERFLCI